MIQNLGVPNTNLPRIVIAGSGFGGLKLAQDIDKQKYQVVIIDKNNYHQFQPLFYQVAMSGLEPSSVVFPIRKIFHKKRNTHFRTTEILEVLPKENTLITTSGNLQFNYLVLSMGAGTHYFGNKELEANALGMKSVSESLYLRNKVLQMLEDTVALGADAGNIDIVVVGGGPTGVEISGSLAEMKRMVFPNDYPEIDFKFMNIHLVEGADRLLAAMDKKSSNRAAQYLNKLGVNVKLNSLTKTAQEGKLFMADGTEMNYGLLIWAAGVKAFQLQGIPNTSIAPNGRIITNEYLKISGFENIYSIGDQALVQELAWPKGHPQVAQPAIQQGKLLASNLNKMAKGISPKAFKYKDLGSMATVGRNMAVAEIKGLKLGGFVAWFVWMAVHLMSIVGVKNRLFIFINWLWSYFNYDQSLRLLIKPFNRKSDADKI